MGMDEVGNIMTGTESRFMVLPEQPNTDHGRKSQDRTSSVARSPRRVAAPGAARDVTLNVVVSPLRKGAEA